MATVAIEELPTSPPPYLLMIDPLFDAVDALSGLLKRLRELRKHSETAAEIEAIGQLIDETVLQIMRVLKAGRGTRSNGRQSSVDSSAVVRRSVG